jgi:hypothetical protein
MNCDQRQNYRKLCAIGAQIYADPTLNRLVDVLDPDITVLRIADAIEHHAPDLTKQIRQLYDLLHTHYDMDSRLAVHVILTSTYDPANQYYYITDDSVELCQPPEYLFRVPRSMTHNLTEHTRKDLQGLDQHTYIVYIIAHDLDPDWPFDDLDDSDLERFVFRVRASSVDAAEALVLQCPKMKHYLKDRTPMPTSIDEIDIWDALVVGICRIDG